MAMTVKPIPEQYHSVQPYLLVEDAEGLIGFIKATFGAEEARVRLRPLGPAGVVVARVLPRLAVAPVDRRERPHVGPGVPPERERVLEVVGAFDPLGQVR